MSADEFVEDYLKNRVEYSRQTSSRRGRYDIYELRAVMERLGMRPERSGFGPRKGEVERIIAQMEREMEGYRG